jgi:hypothetical protein
VHEYVASEVSQFTIVERRASQLRQRPAPAAPAQTSEASEIPHYSVKRQYGARHRYSDHDYGDIAGLT